jgi:hypothetical protein
MSAIPPIESSLLQAAQAQQTASKARDRERAVSDRSSRYRDLLELRVAGVETSEAVRKLPQNESEEADSEHDARPPDTGVDPHASDDADEPPHVDVQA